MVDTSSTLPLRVGASDLAICHALGIVTLLSKENLVRFGTCRESVGEVFRVLAWTCVRDELTVPCPWDEWPLLDAAAGYVVRYPLSNPSCCSELSPGPSTADREETMGSPLEERRISCPIDDCISRSGWSSSMILEWPWPGGMLPGDATRPIPPIMGGPKACASSSRNWWRLMVNQAKTTRPTTIAQRPIMRPARAPGFSALQVC